ncbi:MAG: aspartate-semialdehyde dehydrogenase [Planctomycetota bacterium]|nr:MAG: aspartate-semialdehyde dehydrogenase [Planctomycetota bacterium]
MGFKTAIMGATGAVGQELLELLDERNFPLDSLKLLASKRSAGKKIKFKGEELIVEELTHDSFQGLDLVLSSAGGSISKEFAPSAVKAGAVVVDNTSFYRMDPTVPLVVPEINPEKIKEHNGIIANPNCSTILMLLPLWPLHQKFGVKRITAATYQAASGAGAQAMLELEEESVALAEGKEYKRTVIPHQYAYNLFPHNSPMMENGYCEEEWKMVNETRKIFGEEDFCVSATCVRVPVLRAHSEALNIEFNNEIDIKEAYKVLEAAPGVEVFEKREENRWPMPIDASGKDPVYVGRLRKDISNPNCIDLWLVGDQIRKGAALNAVQIAELL